MSIQRISGRACFYPRLPSGQPVEYGDGIPHFPTAGACGAFLRELTSDWWLLTEEARPVPEGAPCWTFECDECGVDAHELSDGYGSHLPSHRDAQRAVRDYECKLVGRNGVLCEECARTEEYEADA